MTLKDIRKAKRMKRWNMEQLKKREKEFQQRVESKIVLDKGRAVESRWIGFKTVVTEAAEKVIGHQKRKRIKKPWVTPEMIKKMEERRKFKRINTDEGRESYKRLNKELRRETDRAREIWWEGKCQELEDL